MSRPCPKVLLEKIDQASLHNEQVLEATAIYAVFYDGQPINLRRLSGVAAMPSPKYKKVSFSNPGFAYNLQDRLNLVFDTDKFHVIKLLGGVIVEEIDT